MAPEFYERDGVLRYRVEAGGTGGGVTSVMDIEATDAVKADNRQDYMRFMQAKKVVEEAAKVDAPAQQTADQAKLQRDMDQKMAAFRAAQQKVGQPAVWINPLGSQNAALNQERVGVNPSPNTP